MYLHIKEFCFKKKKSQKQRKSFLIVRLWLWLCCVFVWNCCAVDMCMMRCGVCFHLIFNTVFIHIHCTYIWTWYISFSSFLKKSLNPEHKLSVCIHYISTLYMEHNDAITMKFNMNSQIVECQERKWSQFTIHQNNRDKQTEQNTDDDGGRRRHRENKTRPKIKMTTDTGEFEFVSFSFFVALLMGGCVSFSFYLFFLFRLVWVFFSKLNWFMSPKIWYIDDIFLQTRNFSVKNVT